MSAKKLSPLELLFKRDNVAQRLAQQIKNRYEAIMRGDNGLCKPCQLCYDTARELLKLYGQAGCSSPADTNSHAVRKARGAMVPDADLEAHERDLERRSGCGVE